MEELANNITCEKKCSNCCNMFFDPIRAHYRCRMDNKVIYNETEQTCEGWGAYVPATRKPSDVKLTLTQSEIKIK